MSVIASRYRSWLISRAENRKSAMADQNCANCFYAKTDILTYTSGNLSPAEVVSLTCHFWPPQTTEDEGDSVPRKTAWHRCKSTDWCGQWSADGAKKFGISDSPDVTVNPPVVNVAGPASPTINVTAAKGDKGDKGDTGNTGAAGADGFGYDSQCTNYAVSGVTTNATATVIASIPLAQNTDMLVDGKISFWQTTDRTLGGYVWPTLSYGRVAGNIVGRGSVDINESHNLAGPSATLVVNNATFMVDVTVQGKAGTSITWSGLLVARRTT